MNLGPDICGTFNLSCNFSIMWVNKTTFNTLWHPADLSFLSPHLCSLCLSFSSPALSVRHYHLGPSESWEHHLIHSHPDLTCPHLHRLQTAPTCVHAHCVTLERQPRLPGKYVLRGLSWASHLINAGFKAYSVHCRPCSVLLCDSRD